jgi:hypothetical protein
MKPLVLMMTEMKSFSETIQRSISGISESMFVLLLSLIIVMYIIPYVFRAAGGITQIAE